jgi:NAD(P)-dependent dehydrogenase (short-subunit alcohol dehydrogenase family)
MNRRGVRTIVITGGAAGIGRAVALQCATRGDRIAILDRDAEGAAGVAAEAADRGAGAAIGIGCDVSSEEETERAFAVAVERLGAPWGVFANAATGARGALHELPLETWKHVIETNLTGVFLTCKHALRAMIANGAEGGGSIVCTSSPTGLVALAGGGAGAYSASKGGVSALVRCMAIDYAVYGIRVNAVLPGSTETKMMWDNVAAAERERIREQLSREIPLGRMADPDDPARAVLWLLSDESSYVTGTQMVCDGGILAKASVSV